MLLAALLLESQFGSSALALLSKLSAGCLLATAEAFVLLAFSTKLGEDDVKDGGYATISSPCAERAGFERRRPS